jgi:hypothetical protein
MHEGVVVGQTFYHRQNDDPLQRIILSNPLIYTKEATEMGSKKFVHGGLVFQK